MATKYVKISIDDYLTARKLKKMPLPSTQLSEVKHWRTGGWMMQLSVKSPFLSGSGEFFFYSSDLKTMTCAVDSYPRAIEAMQKWAVPFDIVDDGHFPPS
ncbi:hypothetical protein [Hydrogenophaga sp.]|uniref:hypothetical protein n=1 Tax=Hydrogenophaga sp. TaxID=1904254 RepID=UPI0027170298|nr:hypothetical protein [Hydrogenophaga sp.]MDO9433981.1 hypothetical protein [Hydrogenophaga sp.]